MPSGVCWGMGSGDRVTFCVLSSQGAWGVKGRLLEDTRQVGRLAEADGADSEMSPCLPRGDGRQLPGARLASPPCASPTAERRGGHAAALLWGDPPEPAVMPEGAVRPDQSHTWARGPSFSIRGQTSASQQQGPSKGRRQITFSALLGAWGQFFK